MSASKDFHIIVDSREQEPFEFFGFKKTIAKLDAGDYSALGLERLCVVERKSKSDAYQCCGSSRKRFIACLERLAEYDRAAIVIECNLAQFAVPPEHTLIDSRMAVGSFISWSCKYRLPIFWCDSRAYAERVVIRFLAAYLKHVANGHADHRASPATRAHPLALGL